MRAEILIQVLHLVSVEDNALLSVVLFHELHGEPGDGGLKVSLLCVHHHANIHVLCGLEMCRNKF